MLVVVCLGTLVAVSSGAKPTQAECAKRIIKSDSCIARAIFLGQEKVVIPKTIPELDQQCR